jgi:hypothetical protein
VDPLLQQLGMDPKTTIPRFVHRIIECTRKVIPQIADQCLHLRRLAKRFVLAMSGKDAHTPALFVHIQTDINRLTRKIKFATINHGKPPFGEDFVGNKIIAESQRLAFLFYERCSKRTYLIPGDNSRQTLIQYVLFNHKV